MTLREIVDELADDAGVWNDEALKAQIRFSFKHHCARFCRQTIDKHRRIQSAFEVEMPCVNVERVDSSACCDLPSDCDILRSEHIPQPLRLTYLSPITYVGGVDRKEMQHYPMVNPNRMQFLGYDKWTAHKPRSYWIENRIYITNVPVTLSTITVRQVPEDPEKLGTLYGCGDDERCFTIDSEYPAPADIIDMVMRDMLGGKLKMYMQPPLNRSNEVNQEDLPAQGQG